LPAERFTKKANTPALKRLWNKVYRERKAAGDPIPLCVKKANAAVRDAK
jgi:hypothetical protein